MNPRTSARLGPEPSSFDLARIPSHTIGTNTGRGFNKPIIHNPLGFHEPIVFDPVQRSSRHNWCVLPVIISFELSEINLIIPDSELLRPLISLHLTFTKFCPFNLPGECFGQFFHIFDQPGILVRSSNPLNMFLNLTC